MKMRILTLGSRQMLPLFLLVCSITQMFAMKYREKNGKYKKCEDLNDALERREENANVVFTGTVKHLYKDYDHPDMYKGEVEIKRIFKGNNVIGTLPGVAGPFYYKKKVMVDGFGDPHICESDVRKYDTRIFLADKLGNGELRLKSSLVRLTLNNLEHADAAVKDVPFVPKPTPTEAPCERKFCAFGARCLVNEATKRAECKCLEKCSQVFAPVCGSDGVTYSSECHLRVASCSAQRRIRLQSQGSCNVKDPCKTKDCSFGAQCVPSLDGLKARCQCPDRCATYGDSLGSTPVCGSDGRDYTNQCEMRRSACREMKDIRVKYFGKCDPCDGFQCPIAQVCQLDEKRKPICRCNSLCTLEFAPVCGSDGRSYSNECIMKVEACKSRKEIRVLFRGECSNRNNPCNNLSCGPGEECHVDRTGVARCECPPPCEEVLRPVCGSDGNTYDNECELRRKSCIDKKYVTVSFFGECTRDGPCSRQRCDFNAMCVVKNKNPVCECPTCSEELQHVCGSDSISYTNECKLKAEACEKRKSIHVVYQGLCNGCENKKCDHYAMCESDGKGGSKCICPQGCVQVENRVCGTDGETYMNECEMRVASCRKQQFITVASPGACNLCLNVKCRFGARCENGRCVCPTHCESKYEAICANDGQTYHNDCEMRRQACSQGIELEVVHSGECDELSGSGEGSAVEVCDETTCRYGGTCEYDAEGSHGCVCNFNCEAVRSPVCGSDGKTYGNECQMREEQCKRQREISRQDMENCQDIDEELCDGNQPLVNPHTGRDYDCASGWESCPAGSYCHKVVGSSKCCREGEYMQDGESDFMFEEDEETNTSEQNLRSCSESRHGCCPDGKTSAPGPNNSGCPSICLCHPLGAYSQTCDPKTLQCTCKPGVGGRRCDRCEPGFWGLPRIADGNSGCTPCGCNIFGSVRDDCEQMTGRCVCRPSVSGQKCNICPNGKELGPQGCTEYASAITSCDFMTCHYGAKCVINNGLAECICDTNCPSHEVQSTVCGDDGQTYGTECQLRIFSCRLQKHIDIAYRGACQEGMILTTAGPYIKRKTTRHISGKVTRHIVPPTPSTPEYGFIGDFCLGHADCVLTNSHCKSSLCQCKTGYTPSDDNLFCLAAATAPEPLSDACTSAPCQNAAKCQADPSGGYVCLCALGFEGKKCEKETSFIVPSFGGKSYLEFRKLHHVNRELSIELSFKPLNKDGILVYTGQSIDGQGDFVSIALKNGKLQFKYDLGSGPTTLESPDKLELNVFHKVLAKRFGQDGMLQVNDGVEVTGTSPGSLRSLNVVTSLYLGYIPDALPEVFHNVGVELGLVGCVESLKIESKDSSKEYDLMYPGSRDIVGGSGIGPTCEVDITRQPCEPNPCVAGGICAVLPGARFACRCPPGRDGDRCEKAMAQDITIPEFDGNSFLEVKMSSAPSRSMSFEVWFLPKEANGVILYAAPEGSSKDDFISLNLVDRYLQFRYDLGTGIANITSSEQVELNKWHRADISRINRAGTLIVDTQAPARGHSGGSLRELNLGDSIYLGGYAGPYNQEAGVNSGFKGAIQRVYEDGQLVENFVMGAVSVYNLDQWEGEPCPVGDNPCQNGGECIPQLNDYECKCPALYGGKKCDIMEGTVDTSRPLSFDGKTSHRYLNKITEKQKSEEDNRFEVRFKTTSTKGLLMLQHKTTTIQGDYLAIAINRGHVEVSYNLGKQGIEDLHVIQSDARVNDGRWHTVIFNREKRKGTLTVDGAMPTSDVSEQGATQLDTDGHLWIGGGRRIPIDLPDAYQRGFRGCIEYVLVDNQALQLVEDRNNHQAVEFCQDP